MRIPLIFIASIALVSLTACSNEDSEPNVQKKGDTFLSVHRALEEWRKNQALEKNRNFSPGIQSWSGRTVIVSQGFGESIETAFCDAMSGTARSLMMDISFSASGNTLSIAKKVRPLQISPNLKVSLQMIEETGTMTDSRGISWPITSASGQTDISLFDLKLSCELSDNAVKIVSSFRDSRTPGCKPNEGMRDFLSNAMKKEGHGIIKSFWNANCEGEMIEEEAYALIAFVRLN